MYFLNILLYFMIYQFILTVNAQMAGTLLKVSLPLFFSLMN